MDSTTLTGDLIEGMRLPRPHLCPLEIWNLIEKCWLSDLLIPDTSGTKSLFYTILNFFLSQVYHPSIVGSVVECSPATRAARVRFPDDANPLFIIFYFQKKIRGRS